MSPERQICQHCGEWILPDEGHVYFPRHDAYAHSNAALCWAIHGYVRNSPDSDEEEQIVLAQLRGEFAYWQDVFEDRYHWFRETLRSDHSWPEERFR